MIKIANAQSKPKSKSGENTIKSLIPTITKGVAKGPSTIDKYASKGIAESKDLKNPLWREADFTSHSVKTYDFEEFNRAEDIDSYIATSIRLTTELCMKQGFNITGSNSELAEIVQIRLNQIARNSNTTFYETIDNLITGLAKFSNGFIILVRKNSDMFSRFKPFVLRGKITNPIVGMFYVEPQHMTPIIEKGRLKEWEYSNYNMLGSSRKFDVNDVFHVKWNKKGDEFFGTPWLLPALDDIRVLRRMQEFVQMLISKHLFPIYQYKVGTEKHPAMEFENGTSEVKVVEAMIGDLPSEGCIFTNHRHEVIAIDTSNVMDINEYIKYFDDLALSSCQLSGVDVGRGDTANRSTAGVMNQARAHRCNRIQQTLAQQFNAYIIGDILMSLGQNIFDQANSVGLKFSDVDVEEKRLQELHQVALFNAGLITHDEARTNIGVKPFTGEHEWENIQQNTVARITAEHSNQASIQQTKEAAIIKNKIAPANKTNPAGRAKPKVSKNS